MSEHEPRHDNESECEHARANLEELIRGELCDGDRTPVEEHLAHCNDCQDEKQVFTKLTEAVQRACDGPAPPSLRDNILNSLKVLD